jgi:hypothetical protein
MNMDKGKATIRLAGIVTNVMNASDKINKYVDETILAMLFLIEHKDKP